MANQPGYPPEAHRYPPYRVTYHTYPGMDHQKANQGFAPTYNAHGVMRGGNGDVHEEPTTNRKRIAVACGRCRKRKIRCSGDNGNGDPCMNCKNSGSKPCQFLRVSSLEANIKDNGRGFQTFTCDVENHRPYQTRGPAEAMTVTPASQPVATLPSMLPMYQDHMPPLWSQIPYDQVPYRSGPTYPCGNDSLSRPYTWTSSGCYPSMPDQQAGLHSPNTSPYGEMYPHPQDPRYQMSTYQMAPPKPLTYLDPDPGPYSYTAQPTAIATTATLIGRYGVVDSEEDLQIHDIPHGLPTSLATEGLPIQHTSPNSPHTPNQIIGAKREPFGVMSNYSNSSSSPTSSLHALTPTASYGSYTASSGAPYPAMLPVTQAQQSHQVFRSSDGYNGMVAAPTSLPTQFPPPASHSYVYQDMSAAAAAAAASGRRLSPTGPSPQLAQFPTQNSYFTSDGLPETERKARLLPH